MAEDWDLHAVVRGCAANNTPANGQNNISDEFLTDFDSLNFENDNFHFCDSGFNENVKFQGLDEIYTSFISRRQPQLPLPYSQEKEEPISHRFQSPVLYSPSRGRKNKQAKMVREMTHEELQEDSWAWRKYGQKPIKGSPYPRNYYRCSTSKGCTARKQVEKSPVDPTIYIVSFSGDHYHPRPMHRNSLAGSTRNKSSVVFAPLLSEIQENDDGEIEEDEEEPLQAKDVISEDTFMRFEGLGGDVVNNEDAVCGSYCYYTK